MEEQEMYPDSAIKIDRENNGWQIMKALSTLSHCIELEVFYNSDSDVEEFLHYLDLTFWASMDDEGAAIIRILYAAMKERAQAKIEASKGKIS